MPVIDKPGFYTSKAGKCEVVAVKDGFAFGFVHQAETRWCAFWTQGAGQILSGQKNFYDITGPWTDKPKPIEAFAVVTSEGLWRLHESREGAELDCSKFTCGAARLVHLIEAEDRG